MAARVELQWAEDILRSFSYLERCVNEHAMLAIAYLVISVFGDLVPGAAPWMRFVALVIFQALACFVIRESWDDMSDEETRLERRMHRGWPPLLSLVLLQFLYLACGAALFFLLILPSIWWTVKSSLAIVIVCVEELGAVEALKASHELVDGRFFRVAVYLLPLLLAISPPVIAVGIGVEWGREYLAGYGFDWPVTVVAGAVAGLLKSVFVLMAHLVLVGCLVQLYARLLDWKATEQAES